MPTILKIARRELRRMASKPIYWFCMIAAPLFCFVFFTSLMAEGLPTDMPLGLVDNDNTTTSRSLARNLDAFEMTSIKEQYANVTEAREAVQRGDIYGFYYIPKGTTRKAQRQELPVVSFNKPYADAHKIRLVRRMSGGGTIYTDLGGWQFTFIEHSDQTQINFSQYIGPVVDAVRELGADAGFNGRNDLLIDGRKFSGNAQYRLPGCIVHHGSLLYDTDLAQMAAATTVDPYKIQSKSIKSVRDRVTNISEHLPRKLPAEQFKACMLRHLMRGSTQTYCLTPADAARIRALAEEKFAAWDAVCGRNPRFNIERTGHFAGGKFTFRLDVQRGVICQASVWGDFFSTLSAETIAAAVTGCRYDRASVLAALRAGGIDGAVYRISAEDMAGLLAD